MECAGFHVICKTRNVNIMFFTMLCEKSMWGCICSVMHKAVLAHQLTTRPRYTTKTTQHFFLCVKQNLYFGVAMVLVRWINICLNYTINKVWIGKYLYVLFWFLIQQNKIYKSLRIPMLLPVSYVLLSRKPRMLYKYPDFKLSPFTECCMLSFGWFPGVWNLYVDVSEHSVCSIFIGR